MRSIDYAHFHNLLMDKRKDVMNRVLQLEDALATMQGREVEIEEEAQKKSITEPYDQLDQTNKEQIDLIDLALRKISLGEYGICESCGDDIATRRLEAIPWTRLCVDCAREFERKGRVLPLAAEVLPPAEFPDEFQGLSDEEVVDRIHRQIRKDGRIDTQEMEISIHDGVIYLQGAIPSEQERQILLETLTDIMGFGDIVDHLEVNALLWEKRERAPGKKPPGLTLEDRLAYGEEELTEDLFVTHDKQIPYTPPEKPTPMQEA